MKWVSFKRSGKRERPQKLRTSAAGHQSTKLDDELRASSERSDGNISSSSLSVAARSIKQDPPSVAKPTYTLTTSAPPPPPPPEIVLNETAKEALYDAALAMAMGVNGGTGMISPLLPDYSHRDFSNIGSTRPSTQSSNNVQQIQQSSSTDISMYDIVKEAFYVAGNDVDIAPRKQKVKTRHSIQRNTSSVHSGLSREVSHASSRKSRHFPKSTRRPTKHNISDKAPHGDDASIASQGSNTSYSSVFSATYNKLKGILRSNSRSSKSKPRRKHRKHDRSQWGRQGRPSVKKTPKYRSGKLINVSAQDSDVGSSISSRSNSTSPPVRIRLQNIDETGKPPPRHTVFLPLKGNDMQNLEYEPSDILTPSVFSSPCSSANTFCENDPSSEYPSACSSAIESSYIRFPSAYSSACSSVMRPRSDYPSIGDSSAIEPSGMRTKSAYPGACASRFTHESLDIGPTSNYASEGSSAKVVTNGPASSLSINSGDDSAKVLDLPWLDNTSHKLRGLYSGPVSIIPHGRGTVFLDGDASLKFRGCWMNGQLITPLINDDEERSQECTNPIELGKKSESDENVGKSAFNEYKERSSRGNYYDECKRKTSKECKKKKRSTVASSVATEPHSYVVSKSSKEFRRTSSLPSFVASHYLNSVSGHSSYAELQVLSQPKALHNTPKKKSSHASPPKPKYALGKIAHTPRDMIIHRSNEKAIKSASLLKMNDQAFLKRSNGVWTCAVLADRTLQPANTLSTRARWHTKDEIDEKNVELEECMLFVVDEDGATKIIRKRHWGKFIRRLQMDNGDKGRNVDSRRASHRASSEQRQG